MNVFFRVVGKCVGGPAEHDPPCSHQTRDEAATEAGLEPARLAVYLINLDRATARRARMERVLSATGLIYERVAAIDGKALGFPHAEFDPFLYGVLHGRRTIPTEVGCYLSHVACAKRLLASNATHALVLEDDVAFPPDFPQLLLDALGAHEDWDILRLSTVNAGRKLAYRSIGGGRSLAVALMREKGAGAYIVNRAAAERICQHLLPMRLSWDIAFDLEFLVGLRAAFVIPVPVSQREEAISQIQNDVGPAKLPRWRYFTVLPFRTCVEAIRICVRVARCARLRWRWRRMPSHRSASAPAGRAAPAGSGAISPDAIGYAGRQDVLKVGGGQTDEHRGAVRGTPLRP